jgi:hypothetical protein
MSDVSVIVFGVVAKAVNGCVAAVALRIDGLAWSRVAVIV